MRYRPSYEPDSRLEAVMLRRRAWIAFGVVIGTALGAVAAYYLPLLWWYFANGLTDTGGGPHGVSPVPWLAPFGALAGAAVGGLVSARRSEALSRDRGAAAVAWATRSR